MLNIFGQIDCFDGQNNQFDALKLSSLLLHLNSTSSGLMEEVNSLIVTDISVCIDCNFN